MTTLITLLLFDEIVNIWTQNAGQRRDVGTAALVFHRLTKVVKKKNGAAAPAAHLHPSAAARC